LAVNSFYINWDTDFPTANCNTVNNYGGVPMIVWEPFLNTTNTLEAISSGTYDSYITQFAQDAKAWGKLVYLRFGHEMNGNWYGWSGAHNGGLTGPQKYINAWKHIYNIFSAENTDNIKWVWSINHVNTPDQAWNSAVNYYPGDDYVDWIAFDGYNWDQDNWQTFAEVFGPVYATFESYDKFFMISEFSSATDEMESKADWITDAFSKIENNYPKIKVFIWFNELKERDWRVNSSSDSTTAFKNAVNDSYFLEVMPVN